MLKRILIIAFIVILALIILFAIFLRNRSTFQEISAAEAVPTNAILFIDNIDYQYFTEDFIFSNQIWNAFSTYSFLNKIDSIFGQFNQIIRSAPILNERLAKGTLSVSLHLIGKKEVKWLLYSSIGDKISQNSIENELKSLFSNSPEINSRKYEAVDIYDLTFLDAEIQKEFSFAVKNGLLILSSSSMLVEDAIRSIHSGGGIQHEKGFKKVAETAGKYVYGNVYINYANIHQLFYPLLKSNSFNVLDGAFNIAQWGEFDMDFREDIILLNGMSYAGDSVRSWLNIFEAQSPVRLEATSFIPSNAVDFISVGISDTKKFKENFIRELKIQSEYFSFLKSDKELQNLLGVSPFSILLDLLNNEIAWFTMEENEPGVYSEVIIFEIRSRSEAIEVLSGWVDVLAQSSGMESELYRSKYTLDNQTAFDIYTFPRQLYRDGIITKFLKSNFVIYDNYLIFSTSKEALKRTIYQNILHKTLVNEPSHEELNSLISTKANLTILIRPEYYIYRQMHLFDQTARNFIKDAANSIKKIPGIVIQFSNEGEIYYSNISVKYTSSVKERAITVWESLLDSMAISKPYLVTNHYTSEKEIIVQDASNELYLINGTGRILWKIKLDSPVLSDISQIDYYKNGKLQYIFNTSNGIHLIDRNGNYVERYPVKFRADATNGMIMFDYDKRKDYRIFVACADRRVYVYNIEGNIVPGWNLKKTEAIITKPIQHFRIKDKDYILISDENRTYIVDRKGKERISFNEAFTVSKNNTFYLDMNISGTGPRFVSSDSSGKAFGIDLNGKLEVLVGHEASSGHYFLMKDLNQDGKPEYVYADGNELEVIDLNGRRLFSYKIKTDISSLPEIYEFSSSELKIGLTGAEKNLIYLINTDGTLYEGFPYEGNTRFSIGYFAGSDSRFNLIVGSENGFLYNYSIE